MKKYYTTYRNVKYLTIISLHKSLYTFGENDMKRKIKNRIFLIILSLILTLSIDINLINA